MPLYVVSDAVGAFVAVMSGWSFTCVLCVLSSMCFSSRRVSIMHSLGTVRMSVPRMSFTRVSVGMGSNTSQFVEWSPFVISSSPQVLCGVIYRISILPWLRDMALMHWALLFSERLVKTGNGNISIMVEWCSLLRGSHSALVSPRWSSSIANVVAVVL